MNERDRPDDTTPAESRDATEARATGPADALSTLAREYHQRTSRSGAEISTRHAEGYRDYLRARQEGYFNAWQRCETAYSEYVKAAREVEASEGSARERAILYAAYVKSVWDANVELNNRLNEVCATMTTLALESRTAVGEQATAAYREYLSAVGTVLAESDMDSLDSEALRRVGCQLAAVGQRTAHGYLNC